MPFEDEQSESERIAPSVSTDRRVALVIGNATYLHAKLLENPHNDAEAVAQMLARLGFLLHPCERDPASLWHKDLGCHAMRRVLADFAISADNCEMAVVYFAGHGLEVDGENFLLPCDALLDHVRKVRAEAIPLDDVIRSVDGAKKLPLAILDACRRNEFVTRMRGGDGHRSIAAGLADPKPPGDAMVAYATRHGQPASDSVLNAANSPYAIALLQHLETPDVDIRLLFGRVRDTVAKLTDNTQFPFLYFSMGGNEIVLKESHSKGPVDEATIEHNWWMAVQKSSDIFKVDAFLNRFPSGNYAFLAKQVFEAELARCTDATALRRLLTLHADSIRKGEVREKLAGLEIERLGPNPGSVGMASIFEEFSDTIAASTALQSIVDPDALTALAAGTTPFAAAAKERLAALRLAEAHARRKLAERERALASLVRQFPESEAATHAVRLLTSEQELRQLMEAMAEYPIHSQIYERAASVAWKRIAPLRSAQQQSAIAQFLTDFPESNDAGNAIDACTDPMVIRKYLGE